jgi:5S rRNA maturation endonuclease (ribonuclease M5)
VSTLEKFGITSFTYGLVYKGAELGSRDVYIMTDTDRRGEEKKERISDILSERGYTVDYTTGKRLLNMLNVACVEELYIPLTKALENGDKNGKNILRHSKVHG